MRTQSIHIVDEDPSAALVTQRGLQSAFSEVVDVSVASSPNEARIRCATGNVDLLIVDPRPASSASLRLVGAVRAEQPELPILVLTAYDTPGLRNRMRALGVTYYLAKPVELREVVPLVSRALFSPRSDPVALTSNSPEFVQRCRFAR